MSGNGLKRMTITSALLRIGDFESLTYKDGAHKCVSRLKLLVSPSSRPPGGCATKKKNCNETSEENTSIFCIRRLRKELFEVIEDHGHLGCGYIPRSLLVEVIGGSNTATKVSTVASRVCQIQVRVVGPSSVGIGKGMLFVKDGIDKIQLPTSMIKVEKSTTCPLHDDVVLCIVQCFPSKPNEYMGRFINEDLKDPTVKQLKGLKPPYDDAVRVLQSKGVDPAVLEQCKLSLICHIVK